MNVQLARFKNGSSTLALLAASLVGIVPAAAQSSSNVETVIVTGSHIMQNGNESPTPLTVLTPEQLLADSPNSLMEGLDKQPIFVDPGGTPNNPVTGANGRGNLAPGYFLNLRNLGAIRTLVLEDGHRVPGTFFDTTVDADTLPQMLVQRVDVVTGGASAVYGSDAVTGVVNFVLDHKFEGLKGELQGGISGYGDTKSLRIGLAGGSDIGDRGHLIWSVEYKDRDAITDDGARPLGLLGVSLIGSGSASAPYYQVQNIRQANTSPGGLIVTGPGKGLQFLSNGNLAPFNPGTPTTTLDFDIGGDGGIEHNEYLLPVTNTYNVFTHYDYDFNDNLSGYIEARGSYARSYEAGQIFTSTAGSNTVTGCTSYVNGICQGTPVVTVSANGGGGAQYPITIYSGNPFLTPSEQALLFPVGGPTSFQMNRMNNDLMSRLGLVQHTDTIDFSAGLKGTAFGRFAWETYYTHGEARTELTSTGNVNVSRFYAALDAVKDPSTGNIVCNVSLTAPGAFPGCVPLNLFGQSATVVNGSNASQAALAYIDGPNTAWSSDNGLDDFGGNITGTVFDGWAGPIKAALGAEYRLASLNVTTTTPSNTFNPQYLRLAPAGTYAISSLSPNGTFPPADLSRFKEVNSPASGAENVAEGNIEVDAPVLKNLPGVELLSFNGAARYTRYAVAGLDPSSTTGSIARNSFDASTWKVGLEWQIIDDLRVRAARSRDIRAPTLWDLFQGPLDGTFGGSDPLTGVAGSTNTHTVGNPNLLPEVARQTTAGIVYSPSWLAGFSASADYYHIELDNEIAAVSGSNVAVENACIASGGTSPYCALTLRPISYNNTSAANFPTGYLSSNANVQKVWAEGIDFEANYENDLSTWTPLDGSVDIRVLWSHAKSLKTQALPGAVITQTAGAGAPPNNALPKERVNLSVQYSNDGLNVGITQLFDSSIQQNINPTLVYAVPIVPAYWLTDFNISYDFKAADVPLTGFLTINNLFDVQPSIVQTPGYTGSPGMNYPIEPYEDVIGRYFTLGVRFKI